VLIPLNTNLYYRSTLDAVCFNSHLNYKVNGIENINAIIEDFDRVLEKVVRLKIGK